MFSARGKIFVKDVPVYAQSNNKIRLPLCNRKSVNLKILHIIAVANPGFDLRVGGGVDFVNSGWVGV